MHNSSSVSFMAFFNHDTTNSTGSIFSNFFFLVETSKLPQTKLLFLSHPQNQKHSMKSWGRTSSRATTQCSAEKYPEYIPTKWPTLSSSDLCPNSLLLELPRTVFFWSSSPFGRLESNVSLLYRDVSDTVINKITNFLSTILIRY